MGRHLLAAAVVLTDTVLLTAVHRGDPLPWAVPVYASAAALVTVLRRRSPLAALVAATVLATLSGGGYALLLWASYQAGRVMLSRWGTAVAAGAGFGGFGVQFAVRQPDPRMLPHLAATCLVFVALPLLAGRYLAQHERLLSALDRHNRELRGNRELLAQRERLRERLRIAREMHDSLGRRLSLVSVQAAALEVSPLPPEQRRAVLRLAEAARGAMDELHGLVGELRTEDEAHGRSSPGVEGIGAVVAEFRAAGAAVELRRRGEPRPLSPAAGEAAYRVVEEGLTNAAKHAPGRPVTVSVEWEPDALLLTVADALPGPPDRHDAPDLLNLPGPSGLPVSGAGYGLTGLDERARSAGGFLDHGPRPGGGFRLFAMLPVLGTDAAGEAGTVPEGAEEGGGPPGRVRTVAAGAATAVLMFVLLPAIMLLGVG
ncbi:two-component sensor histidine kinase [Planomonospora parontospora subsp. parontospora]|uniref:histidine kinase n=2 Tax=Planomonospora parontospora TaxID=58119 RepID=A0AA37BJN0_9ACTN|nr:histidine kinase [Planomonospora parontospora]GGK81230.1 two-component sensor histidine kinase [Planomonospora parontospora]GII11786.1 two-component sensor histidine kinase [Planomonospora parontospora subsp. parontospora]